MKLLPYAVTLAALGVTFLFIYSIYHTPMKKTRYKVGDEVYFYDSDGYQLGIIHEVYSDADKLYIITEKRSGNWYKAFEGALFPILAALKAHMDLTFALNYPDHSPGAEYVASQQG